MQHSQAQHAPQTPQPSSRAQSQWWLDLDSQVRMLGHRAPVRMLRTYVDVCCVPADVCRRMLQDTAPLDDYVVWLASASPVRMLTYADVC
jgi:hypothetical protein